MKTRPRGLFLAVIVILVVLISSVVASAKRAVPVSSTCAIANSGDLVTEVITITGQMPGANSNGMIVPTTTQMLAWEAIIRATASDDIATACNVIQANTFPYQVIRYTDTGNNSKSYWMLKETSPISLGWGTYLVRSNGPYKDIVIEVPHPWADSHTDEQGAEMFRKIDARALLIAGTHRCANLTYSPCDGTTTACGAQEPYRSSDVAHATQTMFQVAHRALVTCGDGTVTVQLHGNSQSGCPDLFIGNTTCTPGELTTRLYTNAVNHCSTFAVDLADCIEPECPFVGSANIQGRYSNGCSTSPVYNPCNAGPPGPSNPEQFIHLEQSLNLRQNYDCLIAALNTTFPYKGYTPAIFNPGAP